MPDEELYELLEALHDRYNRPEFIADDPVSVPHAFTRREDIEIGGFFAATIAWGKRASIVTNGRRLMQRMDNSPYDFVTGASEAELSALTGYVHRTFQECDCIDFVRALRRFYRDDTVGGLGGFFEREYAACGDLRVVLSRLREEFWRCDHRPRAEKHLGSIDRGAACKRLNMFLRWMIRRDDRGVDFGLWDTIPMSTLYLPLDVHTGNIGRGLGLLGRKQNDWRAVEEITSALRRFSADDPVRYDYALFGVGVNGAQP